MMIPELPSFLEGLGGGDYKGLIIALFTLTAGLSRPFSGKLTDVVGRKPIIIFGMTVCVICSALYPILTTVAGFLILRLAHGFSTGFSPTAITAYVSDIVPVHRRGEAMGIIGVSINLGSSITPPLGSFLANSYGMNAMFFASSFIAILSMLMLLRIKETIDHPIAFHPRILRLHRHDIISRSAIFPALVCGLAYMGFGAIITITPDQCDFMGMDNRGLYFTSFTMCSVLSRLVAGRLSDRIGRIPVMRFAVVLLAIAYYTFGQAETPYGLLAASGFVGFSLGIAIPAVFAWTVDRSEDLTRGKSIATLYIGLEFAIGSGALLGAFLYNNDPSKFALTLTTVAIAPLFALLFIRD